MKEENIIATSKSCAVNVYVTNDSVAARTGIENANAMLGRRVSTVDGNSKKNGYYFADLAN